MTTIAPTYGYTTGAVLDIGGHNANLYSETAGRSVIGEINGSIDHLNLTGAFQVRDYHVREEEMVRVRSDYARDTVDYFSEVESGPDVADEAAREELVNVAGCGLRFWIPYASSVLWTMGFFVNLFRPHLGSSTAQEDTINDDFGEIRLQLSIGHSGSAPSVVAESKRGLPASVRIETSAPYAVATPYEHVCSFYIDLHHLSRVTQAGWCDIHLRMLLREPESASTQNVIVQLPKDNTGGPRSLTLAHTLHNRVSFGIRHPVALVLKNS